MILGHAYEDINIVLVVSDVFVLELFALINKAEEQTCLLAVEAHHDLLAVWRNFASRRIAGWVGVESGLAFFVYPPQDNSSIRFQAIVGLSRPRCGPVE